MKTTLLTLAHVRAQITLLAALLLFPLASHAEDIDIYSGTGANGVPNVLFIMDNAASFDASVTSSCIINGATNSMNGKAGGIEQCAFFKAVEQLPVNTDGTAVVNIGFMLYNASGVHDYTGANCGGSTGGCLAFPLSAMTTSVKTTLLNWIAGWNINAIKAAGQATAATMQEAWAYYSGKTGLSGRSYAGIQPAAGCQKNFAIFVGNGYRNNTTPGDQSSGGPQAALTAAYALTNTTQPPLILGTSYNSCGTYAFQSNNHENNGMFADEWARFMHNTDVFASSSGSQNIVTYTIGLLGPSCLPDYPALLKSMADVGGGKYYATNDYNSMVQALLSILNEVNATNSVFSAASLPVSVNTQGTYLNQIYMGMFRPDASGNPRWVGNLKQYQFALDTTKTPPGLFLADALGHAAISAGGTGFITPDAVSFWTCTSASRAAAIVSNFIPALTSAQTSAITCHSAATSAGGTDPIPGFFASTPDDVANTSGGAYDLQDGQVVEKGGVSQQIRLANLVSSYPTASGGTDSPRKLYIYCPGSSGCVSDLTDASNSFSVSNGNISAGLFGASTLISISSIVRPSPLSGDRTTALVTTSGAHGFSTGNVVTIQGAVPADYNVTQVVTVNSANTFTITGLGDYPITPNTGTYSVAAHNSSSQAITGMTVATGTVANSNGCLSGTIPNINCDQVTMTLPGHGYLNGSSLVIAGVTPVQYTGTFTISNVTANTFTYNVAVSPNSPSVNAYSAQLPSLPPVTISSITKSGANYIVTAPNTYTAGQSVTISGNSVSSYNGTWTVSSPTTSTFNINASGNPGTGTGGSASLNLALISISAGNISRASATATVATVTGIPASTFSNGQTVNLTYVSGGNGNETAYAPLSGTRSVVISCSGTCTTFTFPITTTPSTTLTLSSPTAAPVVGVPVSIPAGAITRSGNVATVTGIANSFSSGAVIDISASGTAVNTESAYLSPAAGWTISCSASCSTAFTFGPVDLTPTSPATGTIFAYSGSSPPDRVSMINWIRGQDNKGDELSLCPGGTSSGITGANYTNCPTTPVTVRPSVHGDVLHSRPITVNYGGSIGVVVYYGSNDGIYHAVNGNQTASIGNTPPGGELWGYVKADFLGKYSRQRTNSPVLQLPGTPPGILPTPKVKDYFIDGPTGLYQLIDGNGATTKAYIYLGMRRGGRVINAFDVTDPTTPKFLWKLTNVSSGGSGTTAWTLDELGQTWSLPRVARVKGYANPVLIFGAGYDDSNEDADPPTADTMGRGIYIVDAVTGVLVWQVTPNATTATCSATLCQKQQSDMLYSIPSDITLLDKNSDGYVERLYATDTGGNVWRIDLEPTTSNITPDFWQVTKLAALGCSTGPCASGTAPRKFFYPAETFSSAALSYDVVIAGSGDREHPLYGNQHNINCTNCAYGVSNRLYILHDFATGNDGSGLTTITETTGLGVANLDDCTGTAGAPNTCSIATTGASTPTAYDKLTATQQKKGYYITLTGKITTTDSAGNTTTTYSSGEKVVNAPLFAAGYLYFGTNQPATPSSSSCTTSLGIARGYRLDPFSGNYGNVVYDGGGMPPSPVAGVVDIVNADGTTTQMPFIIGGAEPGCTTAACLSPVSGGDLKIDVPTRRHRNYWYIEGK